MQTLPTIDGYADSVTLALPEQYFERFYDFDNQGPTPPQVSYRMGYHRDGLYIYLHTSATSITYRQRGFIYGDGIKLVIGAFNPFGRAKEFYEIVYSPNATADSTVISHYISSYNVTGKPRKLSALAKMQGAVTDNGTGFELLIPWQDIYPYHYGYTPSIGINLYFAKGIEDNNKQPATYGYAMVHDEGIWDEAVDHRVLTAATFAKPDTSEFAVPWRLANRTVIQGGELCIENAPAGEAVKWQIESDDQKLVRTGSLANGNNPNSYTLALGDIKAGEYRLKLGEYAQSFIVLPPLVLQQVHSDIAENPTLHEGTKHTLLFHLGEYQQQLDNLKPYEAPTKLLDKALALRQYIKDINAGRDPLANRMGPYRRAFRSKLDGTLQPYTIKLPDDYDPSKPYPLLVFLHGSGRDEIGVLDQPRSNGQFIEIAPYGRDKFAAYGFTQSEIDIREAIDDVSRNFLVDDRNIVIAGFSMGGYGAMLTYLRDPQRYVGLAVFAGHPNLANAWFDSTTFADFSQPATLNALTDVPVFIYHGTADPALDVELMQTLADQLTALGGKVTRSFVQSRGHVYQDADTHQQYTKWLEQITHQ